MRIPGVDGNNIINDPTKLGSSAKPASVGQPSSHNKKPGDARSHSDLVNISGSAREIQRANEIAQNAPDVREAKIADLRARIDSGSFTIDSEAVAKKILSEEFNLPPG